jgi:dTMP kinase
MDWNRLAQLEQWVQGELQPDLTLFFDVPISVARQRLANNATLDKFEQEQGEFFERVRAAYHRRIAQCPQRYAVIDGAQPLAAVQQQLMNVLAML